VTYPAADTRASDVIARYGLQPLPEEGGYWTAGPRTTGLNGILFLLTASASDGVGGRHDVHDLHETDTAHGPGFSALHRLTINEGWQWLAGAPARMLLLTPQADTVGTVDTAEPILDADHPQVLVPAGTWQGASTLGAWTLVACWCSPAFEDRHFTLGRRTELRTAYPRHARRIEELTRATT